MRAQNATPLLRLLASVGPQTTAGQALDGKPAMCPVMKKGGKVELVWIANSREYFVADDGTQFYAADLEGK